jgi:putative nucleotidyltransferase with HDIG domain
MTLFLEENLRKAKQQILKPVETNIINMLMAAERKDNYTWKHSQRVRDLAGKVAEKLRLSLDEILWLKLASIVHDIGKINIDGDLLIKKGNLTQEEYGNLKTHSVLGAQIIGGVSFLKDVVPAIKHHHERYDGTGYPDGLKGEEIPYHSRIISIAEAIDSMMHSPFKKDLKNQRQILEELHTCSGTQFDPVIIRTILSSKLI